MTDLEKPLVTFALFSYNQESYIREAVEGALAQTYEALEIIFSDDCSTDMTFEIIKEAVAAYRGPNRVCVRQNAHNMGIAGHLNEVFSRCSGDLIIVAAGDDVSYPYRASALIAAWQRAGKPEAALHSNSRLVGLDGTATGQFKRGCAANPSLSTLSAFVENNFHSVLNGATAAYTRGLVATFGPLTTNLEDVPLTFRALLTGRLIYVDEVLVDYRVGQGVSRHLRKSDPTHVRNWIEAQLARIRCHRDDYQKYCKLKGKVPDQKVIRTLDRLGRRYVMASGMASSNLAKNIFGILAIPIRGTLRDRIYVAAIYFGLKA